MRPDTAVLDIQGQYQVYTECYRADPSRKTIILVNGSLATTASFAQTVRNLRREFNLVLYDQPYAGRSKPFNRHQRVITKEEEGLILLELIEHFQADQLLSFSWGGICTMLALAHRPKRIEKAVVSSFCPALNGPMRDYLERGAQHLSRYERDKVGQLLNETLGKHLPSLYKRFNHRHIRSLADHEYAQLHFHISEVLGDDLGDAFIGANRIAVPVLFINGEWDEYTTHEGARHFARQMGQAAFACIPGTGHFLDMEHKAAGMHTRAAVIDFLEPTGCSETRRYQPVSEGETLAHA
jgi:rhamnosyltransferase subunit A